MSVASAGVGTSDITPDWPVMQGGFGQRTTPNTGVRDPIFTKALYLANERERLLIVTADLICIPGPIGQTVIEAIGRETGLATHQICVCASHTHSAPLPFDATGEAQGIARYQSFLTEAMIRSARDAVTRAAPCRLRTGVGDFPLLRNRRTRGEPNLVDTRVPVLAVEQAATGRVSAVLFGVGCHPVTLGWDNMELSADFPGHAQRVIEQELGVTALFFNTTEGNVIPVTSPNLDALDPRGYCGGRADDTARLGTTLAREVIRVVRSSSAQPTLVLGSARSDLSIRPNRADLHANAARALLEESITTLSGFLGRDFAASVPPARLWSVASRVVVERDLDEPAMRSLMIACCRYLGLGARVQRDRPPRPVDVPVQVLRVNDLWLLALPGEVLVEVGEEWTRRAGSSRAFIIGLANAHQRYLPRAAQFAEQDADLRYETATAGLEPNGVERALDEAGRLLARLRGGAEPAA